MLDIFRGPFKTLIVSQVIEVDMSPDSTSSDGSCYCLLPCTPRDDWQSLSEVTTKQHCDSSKGTEDLFKISQSAVDCICSVLMLHRNLIPYDDVSLFQELVQL